MAVVDGATDVMERPVMAASVGASAARSWSWSQPSPSRTSSTMGPVPTPTSAGSQSAPPFRSAGTSEAMHGPPYAGTTGFGRSPTARR